MDRTCAAPSSAPSRPRLIRACIAALGLLLGLSGGAGEVAAQSDSPFGIIGGYGVINGDPPLGRYESLGAGWARITVDWDVIQPTNAADWNNAVAIDLLDKMTSIGVKVYWDFSYAPCWANGEPTGADGKCAEAKGRRVPPTPAHYDDYYAFIKRFVSERKHQVKYWGTWNEVNQRDGLGPFYNPPDAHNPRERVRHYRTKLLPLVVNAIKAGDPQAKVVVGELSNREGIDVGPGSPTGLKWFNDLREFLEGAPVVDVISMHAYHYDDTCQGRLAFMDTLRTRLNSTYPVGHPLRDRPVWITETGLNPPPNNESQKADYIRCFYDGMKTRSAWWKTTFYYRMEWEQGFNFGLLGPPTPPPAWPKLQSFNEFANYIRAWVAAPPAGTPVPTLPKIIAEVLPGGVQLSWESVFGAADYEIVVKLAGSVIHQDYPSDATYTVPAAAFTVGQSYTWEVRPRSPSQVPGNWSAPTSFVAVAPFAAVPAPPPVQVSPQGCVADQALTLVWTPHASAPAYQVVVLLVDGLTDPTIYDSGAIGGSSLTLPFALQAGQQYRWRVRGVNHVGNGGYSPSMYFTPGCVNGLRAQDASVVEGSGAGTTKLVVPVTLDPANAQTVTVSYTTAAGTATSPADFTAQSGVLTFPPSEILQTVEITIVRDALAESDETLTLQLSSAVNAPIVDAQAALSILDDDHAPTVPSSPAPATGTTVSTSTPSLAWVSTDQDPDDSVRFDVYLGHTVPLTKVASDITTAAFVTADLLPSKTYSWYVIARDLAGNTSTGPTWTFLTPAAFPPRVPSQPSPSHGGRASTALPTLSWVGGDPDPGDIVTYDVYFGPARVTPPLVATGLTQAAYKTPLLSPGKAYVWRVVARDQGGRTTSGPEWAFGVAYGPGCQTLDHVPFTITESGRYCLEGDLTTPITSGEAIEVLASDVEIDLKGFTLHGTGGLATTARGIGWSDTLLRRVVVRNGAVRGFHMGVHIGPGEGHQVDSITADANTYTGIWMRGRGTVTGCSVTNTGGSTVPGDGVHGIVVEEQGSLVRGNSVLNTGTPLDAGPAYGIYVFGHRSLIEGNRVVRTPGLGGVHKGIYAEGAESVTITGNRLALMDVGIEYGTGSSGPYRDNLATECVTSYIGGTNAGNNH